MLGARNSAAHSAALLGSEKGRRMGNMGGGTFVLSVWFRNPSPDRIRALPRASSLRFLHTRGGPICLRSTSGGEMEGLKNLRIL